MLETVQLALPQRQALTTVIFSSEFSQNYTALQVTEFNSHVHFSSFVLNVLTVVYYRAIHISIKMHIRIFNIQSIMGVKNFLLFLENGPLGFVIQMLMWEKKKNPILVNEKKKKRSLTSVPEGSGIGVRGARNWKCPQELPDGLPEDKTLSFNARGLGSRPGPGK